MARYTFICEDEDEAGDHRTIVELSTSSDQWNEPMLKFHDFLRGCGFVFGINDQIGIMTFDSDCTESSFRAADQSLG